MATGTPVIARRAGALPEIIQHGRTGFLVDDLAEAGLAVERAATLDRRAIRQTVLSRFSVDRMVDDYERVYRSLVAPAMPTPLDVPPLAAAAGSRRPTSTVATLERAR
jgi:glycosyltransferase involved in cell wall biosynthesis